MNIQAHRDVLTLLAGALLLFPAGCAPRQRSAPPDQAPAVTTPAVTPEAQRAAEAALGREAEVLAEGDLVRDGRVHLLVINRIKQDEDAGVGGKSPRIIVTRAAILEKEGDRWLEVLRCDEHLKNRNGYLEGSPADPAAGWELAITEDPQQGLELEFTPVSFGTQRVSSAHPHEAVESTVTVRWNRKMERYQAFDRSRERFLGEAPTRATPQSILR